MGRSEASTPAEHTRTSLCADNRGRRARARVEACCRRMPAARRKPRARRSAPPSAWRVRLPALEQRHWDLIGLGLVAIGIFLVFLVYLGWDGGQAGSGLVDGLAKLVGELHYLVPVALLAAGALVFMRDALPAVRPFRAAALCLGAAGCLALAAGTLGLGAGGNRVEDNGGYVGEGLYDAASTLVGDVGAHIIAVFLFIAGDAAADRRERGLGAARHGRLGHRERPRDPRDGRAGADRRPAPPHAARGARRARGRRGADRHPHAPGAGLLVRAGALPGPLRGRARARAGHRRARGRRARSGAGARARRARRSHGSPRTRRPTSRASSAAAPRSSPGTSPRRAACAARSPTRPTSSGASRTRAS